MKLRRREPVRSISRAEVAQLLRIARNKWRSDPANAGESIGWALTVHRESHQARRLKVDYLLSVRNFDSADALMARCMMTDTERPLLRWRFARSMYEQGRLQQAEEELRQVLVKRPHHCGVLTLGAKIACARKDPQRAINLLLRAATLRPGDLAIRSDLFRALLDNHQTDDAAALLGQWRNPPQEFSVRLLRAQGRFLDALEALEPLCVVLFTNASAEDFDSDWEKRNRVGELLMELLSEVGAVERISRWTIRLAELGCPCAVIGAQALLSFGRFDDVRNAMQHLAANPHSKAFAQTLQLAAAALGGQLEAAQSLADQLELGEPEHQREWADRWLQCWTGRIIADNHDARLCGADPGKSVLQPILADASNVLRSALEVEPVDAGERGEELKSMLATCLFAMGLPDRSAAVLAAPPGNQQQMLVA